MQFPPCGSTYADFIFSLVFPQPGAPTYLLKEKAVLSDLSATVVIPSHV